MCAYNQPPIVHGMTEPKYSYKNLEAYKESKTLVKQVYALLKKFPKEEQYALCDQLRRAVISVPSNIAEGSGRYSVKEQLHFIEIAYGSLLEVECQIDIAHDVKYVSDSEFVNVNNQIDKVSTLLSGLRNKRLSVKSSASPSSSHPFTL
jgi:four helix bundle protein